MSKDFDYTNMLGYHKRLTINCLPKNNKYFCTLWSRDTGDCCGSGWMSKQEINELLANYGLHFDGE